MTGRKPDGEVEQQCNKKKSLDFRVPDMALGLSCSEGEPLPSSSPSVCSSPTWKSLEKLPLGTKVTEDHSHHGVSWFIKSKCVIITALSIVGISLSYELLAFGYDIPLRVYSRPVLYIGCSSMLIIVGCICILMQLQVRILIHIYLCVFAHTQWCLITYIQAKHAVIFIMENLKRYLITDVEQVMKGLFLLLKVTLLIEEKNQEMQEFMKGIPPKKLIKREDILLHSCPQRQCFMAIFFKTVQNMVSEHCTILSSP